MELCEERHLLTARNRPYKIYGKNMPHALKNKRQLNLLFLNAGTDLGGTEIMLLRFLDKVNKNRFKVSVVAFFDKGPLLSEVRKRGFEAILFAVKRPWNPFEVLYAFTKLHRFLKARKIDIVHMYGFYTNILGSIVARMVKTPIVITGVRTEEFGRHGYHTILERMTSHWIDLYISVSEQSRMQMLKKEWVSKQKVIAVHNGIDAEWACPVRNSRMDTLITNKHDVATDVNKKHLKKSLRGSEIPRRSLRGSRREPKQSQDRLGTGHAISGDCHALRARNDKTGYSLIDIKQISNEMNPVRNPENRRQEPATPDINRNTLLISNGVNGCPQIGMIGAFNRLKAQETLVLAAPRILTSFPRTRFVLMGEGQTKVRITNLINQIGLSDSFVLPGFVIDARRILSQLNIFVLATHTEGLPVSILEAMAFGLPVVASRVGGIPEIVKDGITGILVRPDDPEALAAAIIELLENPARAKRMGAMGRLRVQQDFSIEKMMNKLEDHYYDLAQRKGFFNPVGNSRMDTLITNKHDVATDVKKKHLKKSLREVPGLSKDDEAISGDCHALRVRNDKTGYSLIDIKQISNEMNPVRNSRNSEREPKSRSENQSNLQISNGVKTVLLISPPAHNPRSIDLIPMGLLSIAGYLRKHGYAAKVYNSGFPTHNSYAVKIEKTIKLIKEYPPDFIGLGFPTEAFDAAVRIAKTAKEINKETKIIIGGIHPTAKPIDTMSVQDFDFLIPGEGEITTKELLNALVSNTDPEKVKGIFFKKHGRIVKTESRSEICDLDEIPFDNRDLLVDLGKYPKGALGQIHTSRGCPYSCAYCSSPIIWKKKVRFRSVANVLDEINYLRSRYRVNRINFADDNFTLDPVRVRAICEEIIKRKLNINWRCCARSDIHHHFDLALLQLMRRAGCRQICIGFESGTQRLLDNVTRGVSVRDMAEILKIMKHARIGMHADFIVGLPGENEATLQETFQLMKKVWEVCRPTMNVALFKPYPGTDAYGRRDAIDHACLYPEFERLFSFAEACNIKKLSRDPIYVGKKLLDNISAPKGLGALIKKGLAPLGIK